MMQRLIGLFTTASLALPLAAQAQMVPDSQMPSAQTTQWSAGPNYAQHESGAPYVMVMQPLSSVTVSTGTETHHIASAYPSAPSYAPMAAPQAQPTATHHIQYGSRMAGPTVQTYPSNAGLMPGDPMMASEPTPSLMAIMAIPYLYPYGQGVQPTPGPGRVLVPEPRSRIPSTVYAAPGPASVCTGGACRTFVPQP